MIKPKRIRILALDPGGSQDGYFGVLLSADKVEKKIYILAGKEWRFVDGLIDYTTVEKDIAFIHKDNNIDFVVCEKNNTGLHVIKSLQNIYHIPVFGITTSNNIKTLKIIQAGTTMDKNEHIGWFNKAKQSGRILRPKEITPGIKKIFAQMDTFVKKRTPSGKITYQADGKQPDDAVMATLVGTFFIRRKVFGEMGITKRQIAWKKYNVNEIEDHLGSAIPADSTILGRHTIYPSGSAGGYHIH